MNSPLSWALLVYACFHVKHSPTQKLLTCPLLLNRRYAAQSGPGRGYAAPAATSVSHIWHYSKLSTYLPSTNHKMYHWAFFSSWIFHLEYLILNVSSWMSHLEYKLFGLITKHSLCIDNTFLSYLCESRTACGPNMVFSVNTPCPLSRQTACI